MSPPCLDFAGNWQPPPTPPHAPFVPAKRNISEELTKGVVPEWERRREGRDPLMPTPLPRGRGCSPGARRNRLGPGVLQAKGSLPRRERGATGPQERPRGRRGGQSWGLSGRACRAARCGEGTETPARGQQRQAGPEGRERGICAIEGARTLGPGQRPGPGQGQGRRTARSLRRAGPYFAAESLLSADNGSGMFTAGGKTISDSSGEMCHPNVTGKLT